MNYSEMDVLLDLAGMVYSISIFYKLSERNFSFVTLFLLGLNVNLIYE